MADQEPLQIVLVGQEINLLGQQDCILEALVHFSGIFQMGQCFQRPGFLQCRVKQAKPPLRNPHGLMDILCQGFKIVQFPPAHPASQIFADDQRKQTGSHQHPKAFPGVFPIDQPLKLPANPVFAQFRCQIPASDDSLIYRFVKIESQL